MQTKKIFVPLFITLVMLVGSFAAMVPAPGTMTAVGGRESSPTSRSEEVGPMTIFDSFTKGQETLQTEMAMNTENIEPVDTPLGEGVSETEAVSPIQVEAQINPAQGTRSPGVNAGGPYGGPDTFEGTTITFTATVDDPSLIFFRWDFDNDGTPDTGWRMSLTMSDTIDWVYDDDYFDDIVVEAWDGVSTSVIVHTGDILEGETTVNWLSYPLVVGWLFTAKEPLTINQLGYYRWAYYYSRRELILWDAQTQREIASCRAGYSYYAWNWCSISPVTLTPNDDYVMSIYRGNQYYPYMVGTNWANVETDTDEVRIKNWAYKWTPYGFPGSSGGQNEVPLVDFKWSWTEIVELSEFDTAFVEVNNAAPNVYNVQTDPSVAYEGGKTSFTAQFDDPGLGDDWWFRWDFGDGDVSDWYKVQKMQGGATVLFLYTWTATFDAWLNEFRTNCAVFCIQIDEYDYGPMGTLSAPPLDLLTQYDVVVVGGDYIIAPALADDVGDVVADYMDEGGDVVVLQLSTNTVYPMIRGRYVSDKYTPVKPAGYGSIPTTIGTIYVPGHPIFNGVASLTTNYQELNTAITDGATRIADWTSGNILAAEKLNPNVANDAMALRLNWVPYGWIVGGDSHQMLQNAIMYVTGNPWPTIKPMPITTDSVSHIYRDDDPTTTTPSDDVNVRVEVKDDDHEMLKGGYDMLLDEDFTGFNYPSWPSGWSSSPGWGWRIYYSGYLASQAAQNYYFYNYGPSTSILNAPSMDLSAKPYLLATFHFKHTWYAFGSYDSNGFVELSDDGGVTWTVLADFDLADYYLDEIEYTFDVGWISGSSDVQLRFRLYRPARYAYYYWGIDDVWLEAAWGTPIWGLGDASGSVTIVNVEPTIHAGPPSGYLTESGIFDFFGYKISDPALWEPTEWFAYKWDFGDGTGSDWIYKGSLAPPKLDVLVLHSFYVDSGAKSSWQAAFDTLDLIGTVEYWDFLTTLSAPSVAYMMNFDLIVWQTWYGYGDTYPPWLAVRRTIGDNMAEYVDANRGGVMSLMCAYCAQGGWKMKGRYAEEGYGPFEEASYAWAADQLGEIHYPDHRIMRDKYIITDVSTMGHDGDLPTTEGAIRVASWQSGGAFVGAKEHANGARTTHYGGAGHTGSGQYSGLLRNMVAWVYGQFIPTDDVYPLSHQYGDNGVYNVDITVIDDDMGWTWDLLGNQPVKDPMYVQSESHYVIPITVDNVDPTIGTQSIEVYIPAEFCLRVSGTEWHKVSMSVLKDAMFVDEVVVERQQGDPNDQALCTMVKVDLVGTHSYAYVLDFIPFAGMSGSNPAWVVISPWKDPITPGHGTVTYKHDFQVGDDSTWNQGNNLPTLRQDLMDGGHGAEIAFEATASDPGTDDLAFLWIWGDQTPYGIHIHHNNGMPVSEGANTNPEDVGFSEPAFEKAANTIRSPHGTTNFVTRDIAYHMFEQGYYYYVTLIVMDDDVNDPYPSSFGHAGIDMEFIDLDLR